MQKSLFYIWLFSFVFVLSKGQAQGFFNADSLLNELQQSSGTKRVAILLALSDFYDTKHPVQALQYTKEALHISDSMNYAKGIGAAYTSSGATYRFLGNYIKAIYSYKLALKYLENTSHQKELAYLYSMMGVVYSDQSDFVEALKYYNKSMKINEKIENKRGLSINLHTIGMVYQKTAKYDEALIFYKKSAKLAEILNSDIQKNICNSTISQVYTLKKEYKLAMKYATDNIAFCRKTKNKVGLAFAYDDIAKCYAGQKKYQQAIESGLKSYQSFEEVGRIEGRRVASQGLSEFYTKIGNYQKALEYFKIYKAATDKIFNLAQSKQITDFKIGYQTEKTEAENRLLRKNEDLKDDIIEKQKATNFYIGVGVFLLLILLMVLYVAYTQKMKANNSLKTLNEEVYQKQEEILQQSLVLKEANNTISEINTNLEKKVERRTLQLEKSNKELDSFLYHSSHGLKRPITTLKGLIEISKMIIQEENALELFQRIKHTTLHMELLLKKLIMISEINDKNMRLTKCNLQGIVKEIENHFEETTKSKDIKLTISCNENSKVNSSPELLYYILSNLIENSIHFRIKENPFVTIKIESKNQELHLSVSDNGIGILPEYQTKIFEMFFIGTTVSKGNGLGLYVVQKAVNRLNGKITFYSDAEHGTQFKVVIPV